jgi:hypothetical protein
MATATEKKIYRLAALCGVLTVLAVVVPRFVPSRGGGFEATAIAVLVFLGMLFVTTLVSLYLLVITVNAYRGLSLFPRLAGLGPGVVLVTALVLLIAFLRF